MNQEQSNHIVINIKSQQLVTIFNKNLEVIKKEEKMIKVSGDEIAIDTLDNDKLTNVPENEKQAIKIFCEILKDLFSKESKPIIKEIKKSKKIIISEASYDWVYIETITGELAKEMAQISNDKITQEELIKIDKYIYEITYRNNEYSNKEYPVYKAD